MQRWAGRLLESGTDRGPSAWEQVGALLCPPVTRSLDLPGSTAVVGVGGATLGGSGRTPLAIALTLELARRGADPVLVGHGYGARPGRARVVEADDPLDQVGDEALLAARRLRGRAQVVVAPTRQQALRFAAGRGGVLVVDRLLQTRPRRLARSLLAVDAQTPWGSGRPLPFGDLLAPRDRLLDAADELVRIVDAVPERASAGRDAREDGHPTPHDGLVARRRLLGAMPVGGDPDSLVESGRGLGLAALSTLRLGLVTAVARPERVSRTLRANGLEVQTHHAGADHGDIPPRARDRLRATARALRLDVWLADEKAALRLPSAIGVPVLVLDAPLEAPASLVDRVLAATGFASLLAAASIPAR